MPNMGINLPVPEAAKAQFKIELAKMIDELRSHPSIVVWVPFDEGWGRYDVERVVSAAKARDPSRLRGNRGAGETGGTGPPCGPQV
jgi:beta-galactosidase/beta-glucuronidase